MNVKNNENRDVANAVSEYQELVKHADRKLKKYLKAQAVMNTAREEWEDAQKAVDEGLNDLKEILK